MSRVVEIAGCRIAYDVVGAGPAVLFIQGVGLHGAGWTPQVNELRSRFTCLTFDNRGMGRSQPAGSPITVGRMAEDALEVLRHAGFSAAHLVGHSLGGPVALEMAFRQPDAVKSLSLLCTLARGRDATRLSGRMLALGIRSRVGPRTARRRAFLEIVLSPAGRARQSSERWAAELEPLFGHDIGDQPAIAMKQLSALRGYDATSRLNELAAVPTLVVSAALDPIAPPRYGRQLAAGLEARFVEVPGASHGLPIEHPAEVNDLLAAHIHAAESRWNEALAGGLVSGPAHSNPRQTSSDC